MLVSWITLFSLVAGVRSYDFPFQDPSLSWDDRLDDLVGRLTLEEIVPQTLASYRDQHTPAIERLGIKPYVWITECLSGQVNTNATAFPQPIGLAASFSKELLFNVSRDISFEVRAHWNANRAIGKYATKVGLSCFSPVINIMRHPLWGRNQETYGEDPFLSGTLAQNFVRGLQGDNPRYLRANAGCKHFDVHGGPENIPVSRSSFDAKVNMRDWRMTFLPQFKMCVDAGSYSLMCSYNSINGIPACANKQLLTDITRTEWGFKGYVVSDALAISNIMTQHHYTNSTETTLAAAIKAGTNLELASTYFSHQLDAVKQGLLTEQEVRDNVRPLMYTRLRLGEFDPESMVEYNKIGVDVIQSPEHREQAVKAAFMGFVLLKNEGNLLPIKKQYNQLAIVGPFTNATTELFGTYRSDVNLKYTTTIYAGLSSLGGSTRSAEGCTDRLCDEYSREAVKEAVTGADLVIVALGSGQMLESEGQDRAYLDLHGHQLDILQDAVYSSHGVPVILLLINAGPLDITWAKLNPGVTAILSCGYPAQATGEALRRSLTLSDPAAAPAGRLPATWPTNINQIPPITNYTMHGRTYRYYMGEPLYPFGYGLSYSSFSYTSLAISPEVVTAGEDVNVEVCLKNTGSYDSDEVVQLYLAWPSAPFPLPKWTLAAFERPFLTVGQSKCVKSVIRGEQMSVWISDDQGFGFLPGTMTVYAGGQQPNQENQVPSNVITAHFMLKTKQETNMKFVKSNLSQRNEVTGGFTKL